MAKKLNKMVSVNSLDKVTPEKLPFTVQLGEGENAISVTVTPRLNFLDGLTFVQSVVSAMINDDEDEIRYAIKEFAIRVNFIEKYTNIRLPENLDKQYDFVFGTPIYEDIKSDVNFDDDAYEYLLQAIDEQIVFVAQKIQNTFKAGTEAYIDRITAEAEQIISMFQSFGKVFENITPEQLNTILPNLAKFGNEKDLVKAFIDAKKDDENALV